MSSTWVPPGVQAVGHPTTPDPLAQAAWQPGEEGPFYRDVTPRFLKVTQPAAGSDWSVNLEGGFIWHLRAVRAQYIASAAAANRLPRLQVFDGTDVLWQVPGAVLIVANNAFTGYGWNHGIGSTINPGTVLEAATPLPDIPILGGQTLRVSTANIQGADQWGAIAVYAYQVEWRRLPAGEVHPRGSEVWRRQYTSELLVEEV